MLGKNCQPRDTRRPFKLERRQYLLVVYCLFWWYPFIIMFASYTTESSLISVRSPLYKAELSCILKETRMYLIVPPGSFFHPPMIESFFFSKRRQKICLYLLVKQKRIAQLICIKSGENHLLPNLHHPCIHPFSSHPLEVLYKAEPSCILKETRNVF